MSESPGKNALVLVENLSVPFDRRVWQECLSLREAGWGVSVICPAGDGRDEARYCNIAGVDIHRYPLRPASSLPGYLREYGLAFAQTTRLVHRLGRDHSFDVVHACNPPDFLLLTALSLRRRRTAFVFDQHDLVPELFLSRFDPRGGLGYRVARLNEQIAYRLADVVISTNESYRRIALVRGGLSPDDVFVVRSAPDLDRFAAVPAVPGLKRGKPYLLAYLGVMGPQDGVDQALEALAALRRRRDDWHATFVGSGDAWEQMRVVAAELGLSDVVDFTGRVSNEHLLAILSTADVGLAPDPKNPLNDISTMNKIVEYMAVGLPIVSYDLLESRVSAGEAAVYATPNEPASFAGRLDQLLCDRQRRHRMAAAGPRRLVDHLSWRNSEVALLSAYDRALELRGRARDRTREAHLVGSR